MSTNKTIFLTNDNEHCYEELGNPQFEQSQGPDDLDVFVGYPIVLEMSKWNIEITTNDDHDLVVIIKPGTELHKLIKSIKDL